MKMNKKGSGFGLVMMVVSVVVYLGYIFGYYLEEFNAGNIHIIQAVVVTLICAAVFVLGWNMEKEG